MGCHVSNTSTTEVFIEDFFYYLPIRFINPEIYGNFVEKTMEKYDGNNICDIHQEIINEFFINKYYPDLSNEIFNNFLKNSKEIKDLVEVLVCYSFLCLECSENAYVFCKNFLYKFYKSEDINNDLIDLNLIKKIVGNYINLISNHPFKVIKSLEKITNSSETKTNFLKNEKSIDIYIEHHFLSYVLSKKVSLKKFFNRNYEKLTKDSFIRKNLKDIDLELDNGEIKGSRKSLYRNTSYIKRSDINLDIKNCDNSNINGN